MAANTDRKEVLFTPLKNTRDQKDALGAWADTKAAAAAALVATVPNPRTVGEGGRRGRAESD